MFDVADLFEGAADNRQSEAQGLSGRAIHTSFDAAASVARQRRDVRRALEPPIALPKLRTA